MTLLDLDSDGSAPELSACNQRGAASGEWVENVRGFCCVRADHPSMDEAVTLALHVVDLQAEVIKASHGRPFSVIVWA